MYQRRRHNSTAVHHPNTLDGRRVAAPVTLPKAPWERMDMKEEDIKKLEELAKRLYEQKQEDREIDDDGFITIYESSRGSTVKEDAPKD
jgi:ribosomal protein L19E